MYKEGLRDEQQEDNNKNDLTDVEGEPEIKPYEKYFRDGYDRPGFGSFDSDPYVRIRPETAREERAFPQTAGRLL